MKKIICIFVGLLLTACGAGNGGGGYSQNDVVTAVDLPAQRISSNIEVNQQITNMSSSVNNIAKMTNAVEQVVGSDLLASIANNMDKMANSIQNYSNRIPGVDRRTAFTSNAVTNTITNDKSRAAYAFMEYGHRFSVLDAAKKQDFLQKYSDLRDYIIGWSKVFCGCDTSNYTNEELLNVFAKDDNKKRFEDFYEQNRYKEFLIDDTKFRNFGFNNGTINTQEYFKFAVDNKTGQITGIELYDGDNLEQNIVRYIDENSNVTDKFKNVSYKYAIKLNESSSTWMTDSFSNKIENKDELRKIISDALKASDNCNQSCQEAYLDVFDKSGGRWIEQISHDTFNSEAKEKGVNLRYSDFGYYVMQVKKFDGKDVNDSQPDNSLFIGGYQNKQIDPSKFADKSLSFYGTAIGSASYYTSDDEDYKIIQTGKNAATLSFENGHETLVMPFEDYYTVRVEKDGNNISMNLSNSPTDTDFKFSKENGISSNDHDFVNVEIQYYGDADIPTELVGGVVYEEHPGGGLKSFEAAFGMTKHD